MPTTQSREVLGRKHQCDDASDHDVERSPPFAVKSRPFEVTSPFTVPSRRLRGVSRARARAASLISLATSQRSVMSEQRRDRASYCFDDSSRLPHARPRLTVITRPKSIVRPSMLDVTAARIVVTRQ